MAADDEKTWTIRDILQWVTKRFTHAEIPSPLLDAQLLVGASLGMSRVQLYMELDRPLSLMERDTLRGLVRRRLAGEPVAYLLNQKSWHNLDLYVDSRVLIPRPETEWLLDFVLGLFVERRGESLRILDLCTGSGCLAIALAQYFPASKVFAVDLSADALDVAAENAQRHCVAVEWVRADIRDPAWRSGAVGAEGFDLIVANPPYVTEEEWQDLDISVRGYEPRLALVADDEGLAVGKTIAREVLLGCWLRTGGVFGMELGLGQPTAVAGSLGLEASVFAFQHPVFDLPRGVPFALRDMTARERYLCSFLP